MGAAWNLTATMAGGASKGRLAAPVQQKTRFEAEAG